MNEEILFKNISVFFSVFLLLTSSVFPYVFFTVSGSSNSSIPITFPELNKVEPSLRNILSRIGISDSSVVNVIVRVKSGSLSTVLNELKSLSGVEVFGSTEILPFIALSTNLEGLRKLLLNPLVEAIYPMRNVTMSMLPSGNRKIYIGNNSYIYDLKSNQTYPFLGSYPTHLSEIAKIINATGLYNMGINGSNVIVAVLDTGIRADHPDLLGKVIYSVSFVEGEDPDDYCGHGTFVAGIIAGGGLCGSKGFASDYNRMIELQIHPGNETGIAPGAKLLNVKVLNSYGWGYDWWIIKGIDFAVRHGADIISMSLGALPIVPPEWDPLCMAVEWAASLGVVVIVSAGNEGPGHFSITSPSYMPGVISVGACYETGYPAYFSSRGPAPYWMYQKPDVMAPGVAVISTYAGFDGKYTTLFGSFVEGLFYCEGWGTSASAPIVSGVAALLISAFRGANPMAIKAAIINGARDLGFDETEQGAGLIDAYKTYEILKSSLTSEYRYVQPNYEFEEIYKPSWEMRVKGYLHGAKIALLCEDSLLYEVKNIWETLFMEGANVDVYTYSYVLTQGPDFLYGYDLVIVYNPLSMVDLVSLVLNRDVSLMVIGDDNIDVLNFYTSPFNVTWIPIAAGGLSTEIMEHDATVYPYTISSIYFGGAVASLRIGEGVILLAKDPYYPAIAAWSQTPNVTSTLDFAVGNVTVYPNTTLYIANMTLTTNQTSYYRDSTIKIFGRLMNVTGNTPIYNATIKLVLQGPGTYRDWICYTNETGYFEDHISIPSNASYGLYSLEALYVYQPEYGEVKGPVTYVDFSVITRGRFITVSDNDLFTPEFINRNDNRKLLVDLSTWLSKLEYTPRPTIGILQLNVLKPIYVYSNSTAKCIFEARNVGDDNLTISSLSIYAYYNEFLLKEVHFENVTICPSETITFEFNFTAPITTIGECYIWLMVDYVPYINGVPFEHITFYPEYPYSLPVIDKPHRAGFSINITSILPSKITSTSAPLIAMFPGDFKLVNLLFFSSQIWKGLRFEISGNISNIASLAIFDKPPAIHRHPSLSLWWLIYTIGNYYESTPSLFLHGDKYSVGDSFSLDMDSLGPRIWGLVPFIYLQVEIPSSVNPGKYVGSVRVLNGSSVLNEVPVEILVKIPVAKVLQDDVFQLALSEMPIVITGSELISGSAFMFVERLYSGQLAYLSTADLFNFWLIASEYGFDVDPLLQTMFDRGVDDPWKLIFSSEYRALVLIGCERWLFRSEALQNLFAQGKGIIFAYGFPEFPLFHSYICGEIRGEWWSPLIIGGIARDYINSSHPLAWGVNNVTHFMATTLTVGVGGEIAMTAVEYCPKLPYREHMSGVTVASYEYAPTQAKYVAIGDHMLFSYGLVRDLNWLYMYALTGKNFVKTDNDMLIANALKYATNDPPRILIEFTKDSYTPGTNVTSHINVEDLYGVDNVNVTVYDPFGNKVLSKVYGVSLQKSTLTLEFKLPEYAPLGTYKIVVRAIDNMMDYSVETSTFNVVGFEAKVLDAITVDGAFNVKSVFSPGETVIVNATLACRFPVKANVLVQVLTPDNIPLSIGIVAMELPVGKVINVASGFTLPTTIPVGTYTIKVYVWYSVPGSLDWRPLAEVYTSTFSVSIGG